MDNRVNWEKHFITSSNCISTSSRSCLRQVIGQTDRQSSFRGRRPFLGKFIKGLEMQLDVSLPELKDVSLEVEKSPQEKFLNSILNNQTNRKQHINLTDILKNVKKHTSTVKLY